MKVKLLRAGSPRSRPSGPPGGAGSARVSHSRRSDAADTCIVNRPATRAVRAIIRDPQQHAASLVIGWRALPWVAAVHHHRPSWGVTGPTTSSSVRGGGRHWCPGRPCGTWDGTGPLVCQAGPRERPRGSYDLGATRARWLSARRRAASPTAVDQVQSNRLVWSEESAGGVGGVWSGSAGGTSNSSAAVATGRAPRSWSAPAAWASGLTATRP